MQRKSRSTTLAALSAALLLFGAAPAQSEAGFVAVGQGSYLAVTSPVTLEFSFFVTQRPNGSVQGYAMWSGPNSTTLIKLDSYMFLGDTRTLATAGTIVTTVGNPPAGYAEGVTAYFAVTDNGPGAADDIASISVIPPLYGNPTIQQIIATVGRPPATATRTLLSGNIWVR